jgi:hypothetical protein
VTSPVFAERTFKAYREYDMNRTAYIEELFCWLSLAFEFLIYEVDAVVHGVIDATDWHSVENTILIYH